jgi:hypothetical protein
MNDKLLKIQQELKVPKNQTNAFGKYKYRSCEDIIEAVKPLCHAQGLVLTLSDKVECVGGKNYVWCVAQLSDGTVVIETMACAREADEQKGMNVAQITGAASSYARKYALNGLFAIDDTKDPDATNDHGNKQVEEEPPFPSKKEVTSDEIIL